MEKDKRQAALEAFNEWTERLVGNDFQYAVALFKHAETIRDALTPTIPDDKAVAAALELIDRDGFEKIDPSLYGAVKTLINHIRSRHAPSLKDEEDDMDSNPSVIFESGRQEANKEWRGKLYKRGGQELVEMLCKQYNKNHLINLIEHASEK